MTAKPGLAGALLAIALAFVIGLASSLPARSRDRAGTLTAKSSR